MNSRWLILTPALQRILERCEDARNYFVIFPANDKKKKKDLAKNDRYSRIKKALKDYKKVSMNYRTSSVKFTYIIHRELKNDSETTGPLPPNTNLGVGRFRIWLYWERGGRYFQNSWQTLSWGLKNKNKWGDACSIDKVSGCTMVLEFLEFLKLFWIFLAL